MAYDLKNQKTPRLVGRALRIATEALERERVGAVLQRGVLLGAGLQPLRDRPVQGAPPPGPVLPAHHGALVPEELVDLGAIAKLPTSHGPGRAPTIRDYTDAYTTGTSTPSVVVDKLLENVQRHDRQSPAMRYFIALSNDDVKAQARASTERWATGHPLSALDGVPVPVKDEVDLKGYRTTGGTRFLGKHGVATADCAPVARLRSLGAILVGKTNMQEMGAGATGLNLPFGTPRNPWDVRFHTGGSSSGSASIVAAGLAPLSVGCDGGGSIRMPASFCGIVGLKATFGRIPKIGSLPLAPTLQHVGPLAGTVRDCAIGYAAMSFRDPRELWTLAQPPVDGAELVRELSRPSLEGITLGIYTPWFDDADPAVVAACRAALRAAEARGATLREVIIPDLELARVAHLSLIATEAKEFLEDHGDDWKQLSFDVRLGMAIGRAIPPDDVQRARRHRRRLGEQWHRALADVDALVTPTTPIVAPPIREDSFEFGEGDVELVTKIMRYVPLANLIGTPGLSLPVGFAGPLPVGMLLHGKAWQEARLLGIGRVIEEATAPARDDHTPQVTTSLLA